MPIVGTAGDDGGARTPWPRTLRPARRAGIRRRSILGRRRLEPLERDRVRDGGSAQARRRRLGGERQRVLLQRHRARVSSGSRGTARAGERAPISNARCALLRGGGEVRARPSRGRVGSPGDPSRSPINPWIFLVARIRLEHALVPGARRLGSPCDAGDVTEMAQRDQVLGIERQRGLEHRPRLVAAGRSRTAPGRRRCGRSCGRAAAGELLADHYRLFEIARLAELVRQRGEIPARILVELLLSSSMRAELAINASVAARRAAVAEEAG